ncbi:MAG: beta strand repeat-containing protein, partial [Chthoniobacterales bacterium]
MKPHIILHDFRHRAATLLLAVAVLFISHAAIAAPAITATKDDGIPAATKKNPGDTINYTISISNSNAGGTTDALGMTLTDATPANTTDVAGSLVASPVGVDDTYPQTVIGNVSINSANIPYSVTSNDYLGLNPVATIDQVQAVTTIVTNTITATTTQGGTVVMTVSGAGIGQFTYNPPAGFEGSDTFTYRLTDNANATSVAANRTATVTIPISGMVWFINNAAGAGDGRLSSPFNTLAAFQAVNDGTGNHPAANDNIFIYESAAAYIGPVTLLNGQKLIGQDATADLSTITGLNPGTGSAAFPAMNSGNGTITKITSASNAVNLTNGATSNLIRGLTVGSTTGIGINGTSFGTLTVADVDMSDTAARTGQALNLVTGTLSATFANIISTNSSATGITLTSVGGTLTVTTNTTVTNPTGIGISVGTSSASLNFGTTSSTGSGGTGISALTNTGTITFGSLTITPDANQRGLLATDNTNTITATSGTVTTSGATAVEITRSSSTTPLAVSLTNVTATGTPANGIKLTNTSGSFTVTGSGGTCTLATQTCDGGSIQSPSAGGVLISNASNVSLTRMKIQNSGADGISATSVNGFTLNNSIITDVNTVGSVNGTTNDCGIQFTNATGTVTISNSVIDQAPHDGIQLINTDTNMTAFNVTSTTISNMPNSTTSNNGILVNLLGSSHVTSSTVTGCTFNNIFATGLQFDTNGSSLQSNLTIQTSAFTNNNIAMNFTQNGTGSATINVLNNTNINNQHSNALNFATAQASTGGGMTIKIQGNTIGTQGTKDSGSAIGIGIRINVNGGAHVAATIGGSLGGQANTLNEIPNARGIELVGRLGSGGANFKVVNNIVHAPSGTNQTICDGSTMTPCPLAPLYVEANSGDTDCVVVTGNTTYNPQPIGFGGEFAYYLHEGSTAPAPHHINIENNGGDATATAAITNHNTPNTPVQVDAGVTLVAAGTCGAFPLLAAQCGGVDPVTKPFDWTQAAPTLAPLAKAPPTITGDTEVKKAPAAIAAVAAPASASTNLSEANFQAIVAAAKERWKATGLTPAQTAAIDRLQIELADLPDLHLGSADDGVIKLDRNASGRRWFIDAAPMDDAQFSKVVSSTQRYTEPDREPAGRIDLLTAVMHEMGHALGLSDTYAPEAQGDVMYGFLTTGQRRLPRTGQANGAIPGSAMHVEHLASPVTIGTLPPGKSVFVKFAVTINATTAPSVSNQGTVSGSNFSNLLTDDPNVGGAADPTVTLVEQPPVVSNISPSTNEDVTLNFTAAMFDAGFADPNAGDTLQSVKITSLPSASAGVLKNGVNPVAVNDVIARANLGNLKFEPTANYNGPASFNWNGSDGTLFALADATVNITVNAVNDVPSFTKGADQTVLEDAGAQTVNGWATNISPGPADESGQVVNFIVTNDNNALFSTQPAVSATGDLTYTPAADANGSAIVSVKIHDDGGTANSGVDTSAVQTFNINVTAVNDAPTLNTISDPAPININSGQQTVNLSGISEGPANESAQTVAVSAVSDNTGLIPNPTTSYTDPSTTGSLSYTPVAGQSGTAHITVTVQDSGDTSNNGVNSVQRMFTVVVKPASVTNLVSSQNPSGNAVPITFTATVTPNTATGTVQFFDGVTPLVCSENGGNSVQPLVSAQATCTTSSLSVATHPITAQYSGDANLSPSTSNTVQQ